MIMSGHYNFKDRTGEVIYIQSLGNVRIIEYRGTNDCDIEVVSTGDILRNLRYGNIKIGAVKNLYLPVMFGVGYFGEGDYKSRDEFNEKTIYYNKWRGILERCYRSNRSVKNRSYENSTVCEEWHNFQNFAKWYEENWKPWMDSTWQLDKDILVRDNKIYSPETCCFVPSEINQLLSVKKSNRGKYPPGVTSRKGSKQFQSRVTKYGERVGLGYFNTPEEAFQVYKEAKEKYIKEIADKWKGFIEPKVYKALYEFEIRESD